jgi:phosphopantothenoylcysteine decarboxylase/phosphopantothenate--cysteine ligase
VPRDRLEPTPDILPSSGRRRRARPGLVGFAAETDAPRRPGGAKFEAKGVDLMVANDVSAPGVGFDHETNAVTIFHRGGARTEVPLRSKQDVARAVLCATLPLLSGRGIGRNRQ